MTRKELLVAWGLGKEDTKLVNTIIRTGTIDAIPSEKIPNTLDWIGRCYHMPARYERCLAALDELCQTHGVEYIPNPKDTSQTFRGYSYLNTGESYAATLVYNHVSGRFSVNSWGDIVERKGW